MYTTQFGSLLLALILFLPQVEAQEPLPSAKEAQAARQQIQQLKVEHADLQAQVETLEKKLEELKTRAIAAEESMLTAQKLADDAEAKAAKEIQALLATVEASKKLLTSPVELERPTELPKLQATPPVVTPREAPALGTLKKLPIPEAPVVPARLPPEIPVMTPPRVQADTVKMGPPKPTPFVVKPSLYDDDTKEEEKPKEAPVVQAKVIQPRQVPTQSTPGMMVITTHPNAKLYIDGAESSVSGESRTLNTPALRLGYNYTYNLKTVLPDGTTREQKVVMKAGERHELVMR